jgi:hypothetical protein
MTAFPTTRIIPVSASKVLDRRLAVCGDGQSAGWAKSPRWIMTYAEGEAVLGWLNGVIELTASRENVDWLEFGTLADAIQTEIQHRKMAVGHIKFLVSSDTDHYVANLTQSDGVFSFRGTIHTLACMLD